MAPSPKPANALRHPSLLADTVMWLRPNTLPRTHLDVAGSEIPRVPHVLIPGPFLAVVDVKDMMLRPLTKDNLETVNIKNPIRKKK